jgi:hypothetical protein
MKKQEKERIQRYLFRLSRGSKCDFAQLSKMTGIPKTTLHRYKDEPDIIPLNRLLLIADAMEISVADAGYLVTGRRN